MNADEFVLGIKSAVHDAAITSVKQQMSEGPAGRKPSPRLLALSRWYRELPESDRKYADALIVQSVHAAVFGVLAVLDGVRSVEPAGEKTDFRLLAKRGAVTSIVNPEGTVLHDIYQGEVWDEVFAAELPVRPN